MSFLFPTQADFDVSYVNVADVAAAKGPVSNDQAGYVGSPLKPGDFTPFSTFHSLNAWPTFIDLDGTNAAIPKKLPSPLELMARLSGKNAPADITPPTPPQSWPDNVWQPVQVLRTNWANYSATCQHSAGGHTTICDTGPRGQCAIWEGRRGDRRDLCSSRRRPRRRPRGYSLRDS
jgi:hypothetical protein